MPLVGRLFLFLNHLILVLPQSVGGSNLFLILSSFFNVKNMSTAVSHQPGIFDASVN